MIFTAISKSKLGLKSNFSKILPVIWKFITQVWLFSSLTQVCF